MKKTFLIFAAVAVLGAAAQAQMFTRGYPNDAADVTVASHTATLIKARNFGRLFGSAINTGSYDVRITSYPNTRTDTGRIIKANGGYWETVPFVVDISSYYGICAGSGTTSTINFFEYSQ